MACFLPSEISRLVLGYLEEVNCMTAYDEFLKNCPNLQECRGRHFDTRVMGNTLINILRDYSKAEAEMYYNKNKELQRVLRQRWSLVHRMRFLVENVDMSKVRQYSSNNSPFPFSTPRRTENDRKPKLCPQCKASESCGCSRGGAVSPSPALSDFFTQPVNVVPVQNAPHSVSIESLVEATPLSDLPGTSVRDYDELITSSNSRSCSQWKETRLSHDSGVTIVSQKSVDSPRKNGTALVAQGKEVNPIADSEHNMSIDSSVKENVLLECSDAPSHSEAPQEPRAGIVNSCSDSDGNVPTQGGASAKDISFQEFLSGVAAQYDNETSQVVAESRAPDPTPQERLSTCATKSKPLVVATDFIPAQTIKETSSKTKTIKTLLPRHVTPQSGEQQNIHTAQMQAKPPDDMTCTKLYEAKRNTISQEMNNDEIITLYGTDTKEYTTLQTIDISNFYQQTSAFSDMKNNHQKQNFQPKQVQNEQKVIILSNEIVEPKTLQESNHATGNIMHISDRRRGLHHRSDSDSSSSNNSSVMRHNREMFSVRGNKSALQQTSNAMVNIPDTVVSQRFSAQICSSQSLEGGKGTVLAGKLPELIISNGQVQLGSRGRVSEKPKYYSEKEIMSMPTLIMLHSQPSSGADNTRNHNAPPTSSAPFLAQQLPPLQATQDHSAKSQTTNVTTHTHIPTQAVQTKPDLSKQTKTTVLTKPDLQTKPNLSKPNKTTVETQPELQTKPDSEDVLAKSTEMATPKTNLDVKKSASTPRRQSSHIRVLDFNTPSREISVETKASTLPKNLQDTPVSASRTKRRAKSNLFDIREFGGENIKASSETDNTRADIGKANNIDATSVTSESNKKDLDKISATSVENNGDVGPSKPRKENTKEITDGEKMGVNANAEKVPGLLEWQALRRKEVGWDADLRKAAASETAACLAAAMNKKSKPKTKTPRRKIQSKNKSNTDTEIKKSNADGPELDTSLEKNAHLLELALQADSKTKPKRPKAPPRKRNPSKKKKNQTAADDVAEQSNSICENRNPVPQTKIVYQNEIPMKKCAKRNEEKSVNRNISLNDDAPIKLPPIQNNCIINDISSITSVPGAKHALDKNVISINVAHFVNENVLRENNNPNILLTNNREAKAENSLQKDNVEKVLNVSSDKDNIESPLLPYDIISPDGQFLIPSSAIMRDLSSLLETPLKMALDMPMTTPRFISPGSLLDPMSVLKHLEIPTPNSTNTPRANLHCKGATPSSYVSRPTDYSSGSSYYKPDDNEYRIDIAAGEEIHQNSNQEGFVIPHPELQERMNQFNCETSKENTVGERDSSSKNQYLIKSLEISLEKLEAENNAIPEPRSTRPRRTCTLKNLHRPKTPPIPPEKLAKKTIATKKTPNTTATDFESKDSSSSDSSCSSNSSTSGESSNISSISLGIPIVNSSTPKEIENCQVQPPDVPPKSSEDQYTLTPQSKGKMSLQNRLARSMEEKRKRISKKMTESQKVSPKKPPARPRVKKPPAKSKRSVAKKTKANQNINICIRRDSTKPVALVRTVQGKRGATNLAKESYQPTVSTLHKAPCLTKSRRKSSTPRKLHTLRLDTESEPHSSPSTVEIHTPAVDNHQRNSTQRDETVSPHVYKHSDEPIYHTENEEALPERGDSADDIMQIQDYIAESAKSDAAVLRLDVRENNHYESAKRIERDLLDPETKGNTSLNEEYCGGSTGQTDRNNMQGNIAVQNNTEVDCNRTEHHDTELENCEEHGSKVAEATVEPTIGHQPEECGRDEDLVELTISDSDPGKSNYICVTYSGEPLTNRRPRDTESDLEAFCLPVSIMVYETGEEDVRKMRVCPFMKIVDIAPSKPKSRSSKHGPTSKTKKTSEKSKKKVVEKIALTQTSVKTTTTDHIAPTPTNDIEHLEKNEDRNNDVSQMETLLAVQSIVQMDTLYTPDKSRMRLLDNQKEVTRPNSLSNRINHRHPTDDQMCESVRKELERRKQRQMMKDIGLTDSSGGEASDEEDSKVEQPRGCRKRSRPSVSSQREEPPDKKPKPSSSKLDPQTFLKTMGIESVLSKIHGPSN